MWIRIWNPISPPTSFPLLFHNVRLDENVLPMLFSGDRAFDLSFNLVIVRRSKRQDEFYICILVSHESRRIFNNFLQATTNQISLYVKFSNLIPFRVIARALSIGGRSSKFS